MNGEILSIGTELLMGEIVDTNAAFLASRLPPLGIQLRWVTQVGDSMDMLQEALKRGMSRSDFVFTTGGLGPTQDDLTREAIAAALQQQMAVQPELLEHLKGYFQKRGIAMPSTNLKQATLIPSARAIPNRRGTAPGWWVEHGGRTIIAMPGPPSEMRGIWEEEVVPQLRQMVKGEVILTRTIKTSGISEGGLDEMVSAYLGKDNPYLGIYAKPDGIHLRLIASAPDEEAARKLIQPAEQGLVSIVGPYIWGYDEETPQAAVGALLLKKDLSLATAECCTGGLLASTVSDVAGSDGYFKGGMVISNHNSAIASGIPADVVERYGLSSQETAAAMAVSARQRFGADVGIGIGDMAGGEDAPPGPRAGNSGAIDPWGTVYIAIALPSPDKRDSDLRSFPTRLPPRRSVVRPRATSTALIELRRLLDGP